MTDHTARPESWGFFAACDLSRAPGADCLMELRARVERLEQAQQQPIPRFNLRFRGVDLVPPIDCPDPMLWIAERVYEMAQQPEQARQEQSQAGDEPIHPLDLTLREALRLHAAWGRGDVEGRRLDLGWLDLRGATFCGADMRNANLHHAQLDGVAGLPACPHIVSSDEGTSYCGLAEQQAQQHQPEPAGDQPLHTVALRLVDELGAIGVPYETQAYIRQAIREPMQPAPITPAGQGELVSLVAELIAHFASTSRVGDDCTPAAHRLIIAVVLWLDQFEFVGAASALRREVRR